MLQKAPQSPQSLSSGGPEAGSGGYKGQGLSGSPSFVLFATPWRIFLPRRQGVGDQPVLHARVRHRAVESGEGVPRVGHLLDAGDEDDERADGDAAPTENTISEDITRERLLSRLMLETFKTVLGTLLLLFRSRARLQTKSLSYDAPGRVRVRAVARLLFVQLYRLWPGVLESIAVIRPDTIVRWHRRASEPFGGASPDAG